MRPFPEELKAVQALPPATDAAGRTGPFISMKNTEAAWIVCNIAQGNASTVQLSVMQATNVAGAGAKPLTGPVPVWANLDTADDTLVRQSDALNFKTDDGLKNKIVIFQIDPGICMDVNNGYNSLAIATGPSNAANITSALFLLDMRYAGANPPTVMID
jgi:hypothetical protein